MNTPTAIQISTQPASLVAIADQCDAVESWAATTDSVAELRDAANKMAAVREYLRRTSNEGDARAAATERRLEVRIGTLLGPATNGGDRKSDQFDHDRTDLTSDQRSQFRRMAEHPDAVEDVIAGSTDENPASRRQVLDAIRSNGTDLADGEAGAIADEVIDTYGQDVPGDALGNVLNGNAESKRTSVAPTKPDLGGGISHPARYTQALIPAFAAILAEQFNGPCSVLDPFAGTGRIHELHDHYGHDTIGVEIEPEWADLHERTMIGNALDLVFEDGLFDAVVTSPTYGNRLADSHNAADPETRRSYTHDLGRRLDPKSSGAMQWGDEYRTFHQQAWTEAIRVLRPGGILVLNIKDHIRGGERQYVTGWHATTLARLGLDELYRVDVEAPSLRAGANADLRIGAEVVAIYRKPATP